MRWSRIYTFVRTAIVVGGIVAGTGIFWAVVIVGLCRHLFDIESDITAFQIALLVFVPYLGWGIVYLPKHLRKGGLIE